MAEAELKYVRQQIVNFVDSGAQDGEPITVTNGDLCRWFDRLEVASAYLRDAADSGAGTFGVAQCTQDQCEVRTPAIVQRIKEACAQVADRAALRCVREQIPGDATATFIAKAIRALIPPAASPPAALPAETVTVPLEALRNCGCPADFRGTIGQCEDSGQCGCSINLKGRTVSSTSRATPDPTRCEVCDWPLAENREKGCVPGDCSYRPDDPAEQERIRRRRQQISSTHKPGAA